MKPSIRIVMILALGMTAVALPPLVLAQTPRSTQKLCVTTVMELRMQLPGEDILGQTRLKYLKYERRRRTLEGQANQLQARLHQQARQADSEFHAGQLPHSSPEIQAQIKAIRKQAAELLDTEEALRHRLQILDRARVERNLKEKPLGRPVTAQAYADYLKQVPPEHRLNPQDAIWMLHESGQSRVALELDSALTKLLHKDGIHSITPFGEGYTSSYLVRFKSGLTGLFKPESYLPHANPAHEVATHLIDQKLELNLVPKTISFQAHGMDGSLQLMINGARTIGDAKLGPADISEKVLFLDYLIANSDRYSPHQTSNLLIKGQRQIAIDHGLTFDETVPSSYMRPNRKFSASLVLAAKKIPETEWIELLRPHLSAKQIEQFLTRIRALK